MDERCLPSPEGQARQYRLAVCRIEAGTTLKVRLLAQPHNGLITHWRAGGSQYCPGEECPPAEHRKPRTWKGYVAAEVWSKEHNAWGPVCLELTEQLELDMRGLAKRGQLWQLSRAVITKTSKPPVVGQLLGEQDASAWQPAFPLIPCLQAFYHCWELVADVKNPMPPRTYVTMSPGESPPEEQMADDSYEAIRARHMQKLAEHIASKRGGTGDGPMTIGHILKNGKH